MKALALGFVGAALAGLIGLACVHLYWDHQNLHTLVNVVVAQQAAAQTPPAK